MKLVEGLAEVSRLRTFILASRPLLWSPNAERSCQSLALNVFAFLLDIPPFPLYLHSIIIGHFIWASFKPNQPDR